MAMTASSLGYPRLGYHDYCAHNELSRQDKFGKLFRWVGWSGGCLVGNLERASSSSGCPPPGYQHHRARRKLGIVHFSEVP